jgi:hypothetical protein
LSPWDGTAIARPWVRDGVASRIAAEALRRLPSGHRFKPWRAKSGRVPVASAAGAFRSVQRYREMQGMRAIEATKKTAGGPSGNEDGRQAPWNRGPSRSETREW